MREIKFRAWDTTSKKIYSLTEIENYPMEYLAKGDTPYTKFMQYTGLKDKNGKEIYEGDICKMLILGTEEVHNPLKSLLHVIEWGDSCWGFRPLFPDFVHEDDREWRGFYRERDNDWNTDYFEVIGNIYENPELVNC
jgi:uncharacterized phage protein (TIGR01671 family)